MFAVGSLCCSLLSTAAWADRLPLETPAALISPAATEPSIAHATDTQDFYQGVKAYREGDYKQANRSFAALHKQAPENTRITYYLAISEAQLGRFQQAKKLYSEIISLDPNGKAASLAKQGLDYLPKETELDLPPRFEAAVPEKKTETAAEKQEVPHTTAPANPNEAMAQAFHNGMQNISPQDWMTMQMLMGGQQNGQTGGMNPMSWMMPGMMGQAGQNGSAASGMDPNIMSNMMMNQMMQGFGSGGGGESNP